MDFSILLNDDKCRGCTNCMKKCPTQAIRIKSGKASIDKNRCVYCGECVKACPHNAYTAYKGEKTKKIQKKYSIAIPSTTVYGQFPIGTDICNIQNAVKNLGFDYVFDESHASALAAKAIELRVEEEKEIRPIISTNCPAIVRLLKVRYPSLLDNMITIESPMEIAAFLAKKFVTENINISEEELEVYYISPCPAQLLAMKNPLCDVKSHIDYVIPFNTVYGDLVREVTKSKNVCIDFPTIDGLKWAVSGGQCETSKIESSISAFGIENIIGILEEIENGKLDDVDFVELLICTEGCVGGTFNVENPFLAKRNINHIIKNLNVGESLIDFNSHFDELYKQKSFDVKINFDDIIIDNLPLAEAIKRIEKIEEINSKLPGLDCGSCGSPSCRAYAEDVYNGHAIVEGCKLLNRNNKEN